MALVEHKTNKAKTTSTTSTTHPSPRQKTALRSASCQQITTYPLSFSYLFRSLETPSNACGLWLVDSHRSYKDHSVRKRDGIHLSPNERDRPSFVYGCVITNCHLPSSSPSSPTQAKEGPTTTSTYIGPLLATGYWILDTNLLSWLSCSRSLSTDHTKLDRHSRSGLIDKRLTLTIALSVHLIPPRLSPTAS